MNIDIEQVLEFLAEAVDGGVCESIDSILESEGYPSLDDMDPAYRAIIEVEFFTCENCGWTHKDEDRNFEQYHLCNDCSVEE